jgi:hypothetical protein
MLFRLWKRIGSDGSSYGYTDWWGCCFSGVDGESECPEAVVMSAFRVAEYDLRVKRYEKNDKKSLLFYVS